MDSRLPPKLCPKIILEGTRLTRKTEIAFALNEHPRIVGPRKYRYHSPIVSAEWCGFTNKPWGRGIINFEPEEEEKAMKTYEAWVTLFELLKYYSWIVDRFHVSTIVYQSKFGIVYDFAWLEERLLALRFCIVFCKMEEAAFLRAREERLKVSGNPSQYDDIGVFVEEQKMFAVAVKNSKLPHLDVDVSGGNINSICNHIADWLSENNLLGFLEE